jgi:ABC transporter
VEELMDQEVQHLSGGELQRVAITMALGMPADIYLIDEPSAYLDSEQRIIAAKVRVAGFEGLERQCQAAGPAGCGFACREATAAAAAAWWQLCMQYALSAGSTSGDSRRCESHGVGGAAGHQALHHAQQEGASAALLHDSTPPHHICYQCAISVLP